MNNGSLPRQIVFLVSLVLATFIGVLWFSVFSIRVAMDDKAAESTTVLMRGRLQALQGQTALIASDYHNWTDIYLAAAQQNYRELSSNYGITAARGDVFDFAEMFDGPFPKPVSWSAGQGLAPQKGFLTESTLHALRRKTRNLQIEDRETFNYFGALNGELAMFSASRLLPENSILLQSIDIDATAIATIGKVISDDQLQRIAAELNVSALHTRFTPPPKNLSQLRLSGVSGETVAYLAWQPPTPGTNLFDKMFWVMLGVTLTFTALSVTATRLLRDKARALIRKESEAVDQARTDPLTGLPNRLALWEHLANLSGPKPRPCAILAIDLDRFKQINDVVGHVGGDLFLSEFSKLIAKLADANTFVSRYGGDEFFIIFSCPNNLRGQVARKTTEIGEILKTRIPCGDVVFDITASKGLAYSRIENWIPEELLRRADRAMYAAKLQRTQDVVLYGPEMETKDNANTAIEVALRSIKKPSAEFSFAYQPIICAAHPDKLVRLEALARWHSPVLGHVQTEDFIRVAELTGLIVPLGWTLLDIICRDMCAHPEINVSINISPLQIMTPGFANDLADRVAGHGVDCARIEIEVTENIVIEDDATISKELWVLRSKGFSVALDDFGTGFSSVGYLINMPFDVLKIDRSFISGADHTDSHYTMAKSIIGLAHALGLKVVAEGVECAKDMDNLRGFNCDFLQGYHVGQPAPIGDAIAAFKA
ncbi:hypothetical protein BFP70_16090 [Thioclava sp. SK-1]|uniref:putative bifunctional diguanylate cyclase/phosphodiesterase n=1 Tax=Thioclava sp. SK-1 TaxID=1889770 RepID=UPI000823FDF6|nr:EAL domain-containing protein [Thioclava sp. SK-1]OCX60985.1 hypothetical protein BFP70_16090 [Thioclava sp. SK-1]